MKYFLTLLLVVLSIASSAQSKKLLEIDPESFAPVQTDVLSGVAIDKIGMDDSKRPCARLKIHINRMTKQEVEGVSVRIVGGNVALMRHIVASEGNGIIIELTAKEQTRFYLHHDKYGDSNEVSLNLDGNREYQLSAMLNTMHSIVVTSNMKNGDVYIDDIYKGTIGESFYLTISDIYPGKHKIKVQQGALFNEEEVEVNTNSIHFRINIDYEKAKPQFVVFQVSPKDADVIIDKKHWTLDQYDSFGEVTVTLNNGRYDYSVSAKDYHTESGTIIVDGSKIQKLVNLRPAYGWLKVSGAGKLQQARVYIDNEYVGITPISPKKLSSGPHTVRIVRDLYVTNEETVEIKDGETLDYAPELTADYATVTLSSEDGSMIYVNNRAKGPSPWTGDLPSGTYIFEARKEGCKTSSLSTTISAAKSRQKYVIDAPVPIMGSVTLKSSPSIADIYIDNNKVGTTPYIAELTIGNHTLSVRKEGYRDMNKTLSIEEGANRDVVVDLSEKEVKFIHTLEASYSYPLSSGDVVYESMGFRKYGTLHPLEIVYMIGCRFNPWISLSIGTGLTYDLVNLKNYGDRLYGKYENVQKYTNWNIPILLNMKVYLSKGIHQPMISLSGGIYVPNVVGLCDFGIGWNFRLNRRCDMYLLASFGTVPYGHFDEDVYADKYIYKKETAWAPRFKVGFTL